MTTLASPLVVIENVKPELDDGNFSIKRIVGDKLEVSADIFCTQNYTLRAALKHRMVNDKTASANWAEVQMTLIQNDRWSGSFNLEQIGLHEYTIEAWIDEISTLHKRVEGWASAGENIKSDHEDLKNAMENMLLNSSGTDRNSIASWTKEILSRTSDASKILEILKDPEFSTLAIKHSRSHLTKYRILNAVVDPEQAGYASWYEMFHRSQGKVEGKSGTLKDCIRRLPEIKEMGFDTVYLPPVHPIGHANRRGRNNEGLAKRGDPGSPWAIGSENGGHTAINPDLGTMEDMLEFLDSAKRLGISVALDLAFQCSPDHPYVKEHPEWFLHRSDGSIRYAENPPKKYYDIYPLDFQNEYSDQLWEELRNVVSFWIEKGVKVFRVDNPHTKPVGFWSYLIRETKQEHPEVIFLSEAFTRPKPMKYLAKIGFTQSYTYFTWKNAKWELDEFLHEFFLSDTAEYYRGNLFTNTPDILTEYLQKGGRPAFKIRFVLAATLSSIYGIYNGFELCENRAKAGTEEYLNSEKYEYKVWDWDRPGNIKDFIKKVNTARSRNAALQEYGNLHLLHSDNENIFFYGRWGASKSNVILVAVNLDPYAIHDSMVYVPISDFGIKPWESYLVRDLITDAVYKWQGSANYVKLDPSIEPAHVLLLQTPKV